MWELGPKGIEQFIRVFGGPEGEGCGRVVQLTLGHITVDEVGRDDRGGKIVEHGHLDEADLGDGVAWCGLAICQCRRCRGEWLPTATVRGGTWFGIGKLGMRWARERCVVRRVVSLSGGRNAVSTPLDGAIDEQKSGEEGGVQSQWSAQWPAYDSDLVMHPATDTDEAAVSSVSRTG